MSQKKPMPKREIKKGKVVAKYAANFRKQPAMDADLVRDPIMAGEFVDILSEKVVDDVKWYRVKYADRVGYILGELVATL